MTHQPHDELAQIIRNNRDGVETDFLGQVVSELLVWHNTEVERLVHEALEKEWINTRGKLLQHDVYTTREISRIFEESWARIKELSNPDKEEK